MLWYNLYYLYDQYFLRITESITEQNYKLEQGENTVFHR